jgi:hypothetical protein
VSAFVILWFFLTRHPCRIVTTSADAPQLEAVLWGEIRRYIDTARYPLDHKQGGPLIVNHLLLRKVIPANSGRPARKCGISYCIGRVASKGEGMLGHHVAKQSDRIPRTLAVFDEASGCDDDSYERTDTWAERKLIIGNPYPTQGFFQRMVKGGDIPMTSYT